MQHSECSPGGFTLVEVVVVMAVLAVMAALSTGPVQRLRDAAALHQARHIVTAAVGAASSAGARYGGPAVLEIDAAGEALELRVDTAGPGRSAVPLTVRRYDLAVGARVDLESDRDRICFDPRGVGVARPPCRSTGGTFVLRVGRYTDTVRLSAVGRVRP